MEDREELVKRWMTIAEAVFAAEHAIIGEWRERLNAAKSDPDKAAAIKDDYLRAIAEEILSKSTEL